MTDNNNVGFLKIVLIIFAVVCIVYGIGYLFVPGFLVDLSGGDPVLPGWLRWSGAVLVALGVGAILAFLKPSGQGIFVTTIALGCSLSGLAMLWNWINIVEGMAVWFTAMPAIIVLALAVLLWWCRQSAKKVLYPE
jgi:hypothetical protein